MSDFRDRVKGALQRHHAKTAKTPGVKRKNGKPEQLIVNEIKAWGKRVGCDLHVVESKAVYSKAAGRYLHTQTSESLPDLIGNYRDISVWIEAKAKGRRSTLKDHQRAFLVRKIEQGCFAACVDNVVMLGKLFTDYLIEPDSEKRRILLMENLPKKREKPPEIPPFS